MATKRSMWVLFAILAISIWILGDPIQVEAETLNFKSYVWMIKSEGVSLDDVEGHRVALAQRGGFYVLESGEIATIMRVSLNDLIKGAGSTTSYETIKFSDGSTLMLKNQGVLSGTTEEIRSLEVTSQIIKGTGRFKGIKGTGTAKRKVLPAEKGEAGSKQVGEGSITYTLPSK